MDYGHQYYLDTLADRCHIVLRALENLERRAAEVLYEKEKWFRWVRQLQEDDESNREKEKKKVKMEAAMFKRHWKNMQAQSRPREKKKRSNGRTYFSSRLIKSESKQCHWKMMTRDGTPSKMSSRMREVNTLT